MPQEQSNGTQSSRVPDRKPPEIHHWENEGGATMKKPPIEVKPIEIANFETDGGRAHPDAPPIEIDITD